MEKGSVERVEVLAVGLPDMLGCFSEKVRAVTQEVMRDGQRLSAEEINERVQIVQEEVYRESVQKYNDFLRATAEAERDLLAKIARLRDLEERASILKELIVSLVKPRRTELTTFPPDQELHMGVHPQGQERTGFLVHKDQEADAGEKTS